MSRRTEFSFPVDVLFDGRAYFDVEYPYDNVEKTLQDSDPILSLTDVFVSSPDGFLEVTDDGKSVGNILFGGSVSNGSMGFVAMCDQSGKVRWLAALGDSNPVVSVHVEEQVVALTSSGLKITIADPLAKKVSFSLNR